MKKEFLNIALALSIWVSMLFVLSLSSCRTCTPQLIIRDSIQNKYLHDSIDVYKHDSIRVIERGDTVLVDTWHTLIKYKETAKVDSFYIAKTFEKKVPVIKEVVPTWCWYLLAFFVGFLVFGIVKLILYLKLR